MGKSPSYVSLRIRGFIVNVPTRARGAVLGALSTANKAFCTPIELQESLKTSCGATSPYTERSTELVSYAEGLTNVPVSETLAVSEAASLFNVWMEDKAISRGARHLSFSPVGI